MTATRRRLLADLRKLLRFLDALQLDASTRMYRDPLDEAIALLSDARRKAP